MAHDVIDFIIKIIIAVGLIYVVVMLKNFAAFASAWGVQKFHFMYWRREAFEMDILRQLCDDAIHASDKLAATACKLNGPDMESTAKKKKALETVNRFAQAVGLPEDKTALCDDMIEAVLGAHMMSPHDHGSNGGDDDDDSEMS